MNVQSRGEKKKKVKANKSHRVFKRIKMDNIGPKISRAKWQVQKESSIQPSLRPNFNSVSLSVSVQQDTWNMQRDAYMSAYTVSSDLIQSSKFQYGKADLLPYPVSSSEFSCCVIKLSTDH